MLKVAIMLVFCFSFLSMAGTDFYRSGYEHTGYQPHERISLQPEQVGYYGLVNVGIHTASKSSPMVADGVIYVGADDGIFYAIKERGMKVLWQFKVRPTAKYGIHATAALDDDHVYFGAYDGWFYALDRKTGRLVWQARLGNYIGASAILEQDRLYVGVETNKANGYLVCVDRNTGKEIYRSSYLSGHTHCTPALNPKTGRVFMGANSDIFFALDGSNGIVLWQYRTGGDIKSTAALVEDKVLFSSWDHYIYCLSQENGTLIWRFQTTGRSMSSPTVDVDARRVYVGSHDGYMYALDLDKGTKIWSFKTGRRIKSSGTLVRANDGSGKVLVFGSKDNNLYGLNAETGELHFKIETQGEVSCVPTIQNGKIYISGDDGILRIFK